MQPSEVAKSYDSLADHWASDEFPRQNGIAAHQRALSFLKGRGSALDVGCGSSGRIIDLLLEHGLDVEGLDLSERMLELARRRHPEVTFHRADICEWTFARRYDFISAWDSIWHVPLARQEEVLAKILDGLCPRGVAIFTAGGTDAPDETRDAAMGPPMYHATAGIPRILEIVADSGCIVRHFEYDQYPELHAFLIVQRTT